MSTGLIRRYKSILLSDWQVLVVALLHFVIVVLYVLSGIP